MIAIIRLFAMVRVPVQVVEDHSDCLFFIQRLLGRGKLPLSGFGMLHFDSHPDLCAPADFTEAHLESSAKMRETTSIESWILPLVAAGHLNKIIWCRPSWADQLPDGKRTVHVGFAAPIVSSPKHSTRLTVNWPTEYFTSDGTLASLEEMKDAQPCQISVTDVEHFEADHLSAPWVLDVDLGKLVVREKKCCLHPCRSIT